MRVLLAIDDSPHSAAAIEDVARRPWPEATLVRVLCVVPIIRPMATELWYVGPADMARTEEAVRAHAAELLRKTAERLRGAGAKVEESLRSGDPRTEIVDEASEWQATLVIVGSHGYTGIKRLLLGSVAQHVVAHAPCSVEVVRRSDTR